MDIPLFGKYWTAPMWMIERANCTVLCCNTEPDRLCSTAGSHFMTRLGPTGGLDTVDNKSRNSGILVASLEEWDTLFI